MEIKLLWELQLIEEKKGLLEKKMKIVPEFKELKALKHDIEEGQAELRAIKEELMEDKKTLKKTEGMLKELREKSSQAESELYSGTVTNLKEMESAEKNISHIKQTISSVEERALNLMDLAENNEVKLNKLMSVLEQKKNDFRRLNKQCNDRKLELASKLEELQRIREAVLAGITPELRLVYDKVSLKFAGEKAIALANRGICSGCNMGLSFDLIKKVKNGELVFCDNCGRLLCLE